MIQGQFAVQSKINIVQLLHSQGETDRYINDHQDKYHYVIHRINEAAVFDKSRDDGWVDLPMLQLRTFLGKRYADRIIKELLGWGLIQCDGHYVIPDAGRNIKGKALSYRIHPAYQSKTILVEVFKVEVMGRKLKLQQQQYQKSKQRDARWKNLTQLAIRWQEAMAFIEAKRQKAIEEYTFPDELIQIEREYTTSLESIRKIANREYFLEQPDPTSRLYTNLSNLSTELRQFLYYRRATNELVNLDIANSQPYLFSLLLMEYYTGRYIPADVQKYIELTSNGKFYEYLMEQLNVAQNERKSFKTDFFGKVFYCSSHYSKRTIEGQFFQQEFPHVTTVVDYYKEAGKAYYQDKPFRHLAITMQRREANIMLQTIGSELESKQIWYNTIHDSIVCMKNHAETVKSLIIEAFSKAVGIPPLLRLEHLSQPV